MHGNSQTNVMGSEQLQIANQVALKNIAAPVIYYDSKQNVIITPTTPEDQGSLGVYDIYGNELERLPGNVGVITNLKKFGNNNNHLITCQGADETSRIDLWGLSKEGDQRVWESDIQKQTNFADVLGCINSDGKKIIIAAGGAFKPYYSLPIFLLLDASNGQVLKAVQPENHTNAINMLKKSPEAPNFVTSQIGGQILCVWDLDGNNVATINASSNLCNNLFALLQHSQLGTFIVSMDSDNCIKFWAANNDYRLYSKSQWEDQLSALEVSSDQKQMIIGGYKGKLTLFDIKNITDITPLAQFCGHTQSINAIKFLANYILTAAGNDFSDQPMDNTVRLWDKQGNLLSCLRPENNFNALSFLVLTSDKTFIANTSSNVMYFVSIVNQANNNNYSKKHFVKHKESMKKN